MTPAATIWVVTDGRAGNERQALALARALSIAEPQVWRLQARSPWKQAAPRQVPGSAHAFGDAFRLALHEPPQVAVGCGRQGALATRLLRKVGTRVVQILDPRINARHWDAVVVPEHDRLRGPNVVTLLGSLHDVDAAWLAQSRSQFPQFFTLPSPRTLLLLGGPIANVPLDAGWWQRTADALHTQHRRDGGSVSICASGRTPTWLSAAARMDLADIAGVRWFDAKDGENPYAGLLGWAEHIVVTPDSVNMLSEAAATSATMVIAEPQAARGRHADFVHALIERGRAVPLHGDDEPAAVTPLIELPRVAAEVRLLLGD